MSNTETEARPTEVPPTAGDGDGAENATVEAPRELEELTADLIGGAVAGLEPEPTLQPPAEAVTAARDGVALWVTNKQVDALYSTYSPRFSWMHVAGGPWRRFAPVSDSGVSAMAMLAAHARDRGRPVNYREEADQLVHEIYVW